MHFFIYSFFFVYTYIRIGVSLCRHADTHTQRHRCSFLHLTFVFLSIQSHMLHSSGDSGDGPGAHAQSLRTGFCQCSGAQTQCGPNFEGFVLEMLDGFGWENKLKIKPLSLMALTRVSCRLLHRAMWNHQFTTQKSITRFNTCQCPAFTTMLMANSCTTWTKHRKQGAFGREKTGACV